MSKMEDSRRIVSNLDNGRFPPPCSEINKQYDDNILDIFRIFATVQVFLGHITTHLLLSDPDFHYRQVSEFIYFIRGVPILFALSGFLAARSLDTQNTKIWLVGRAARLMPAFWVCVAVNTIIIVSIYSLPPSLLEGSIYAVTQFFALNFYTGGWLRGYGVGAPNGALWTIPVQIQFFILAPYIYKFMKKMSLTKSAVFIGGLTGLSIMCEWSCKFLPEVLYKLVGVSVFPYLYFLVFGMMAWHFRDQLIPTIEKFRWHFAVAYILWKIAEINFSAAHWLDGYNYNTVTTLLLACVIFGFAFRYQWRCTKDYTYGFYLYHMVFVNLCIELGYDSLLPMWRGVLILMGIVVTTFICAVLSKKYIEKPIGRLIEKKGRLSHD